MERFKPDSLLDGLLRPFLLFDPQSFHYIEFIAPDARFFGLAVAFVALLLFRKLGRLSETRWRALAFLVVTFYLWTFVSGNGRYFLPGLLIVAPLFVALCQDLPGTRSFRWFFISLVVAAHSYAVVDFYTPSPWSVGRWYEGDAIALSQSHLRESPAVFVKVSGNSYSALTPHFHPQSRWAMLGDHLRLDAASFERKQLESMFASELPKYVMIVQGADIEDELGQPMPEIRKGTQSALASYGIETTGEACDIVSARDNGRGFPGGGSLANADGFWFCKFRRIGPIHSAPLAQSYMPASRIAVFEKVETGCPRFFPSGSGYDAHADDRSRRSYKSTDIAVFITPGGNVSYRYMRNLNRTHIGTEREILLGSVAIPCTRLDGRYRPPWLRD